MPESVPFACRFLLVNCDIKYSFGRKLKIVLKAKVSDESKKTIVTVENECCHDKKCHCYFIWYNASIVHL